MENSPTGLKVSLLDSQLLHGIFVQNVDVVAAIYQNSGEVSSSPLCGKRGIQHQGIRARVWHHLRVVSSAPADGLLRPMHELRVTGGDRVDFLLLSAPAAPIFCLGGEHDVGGLLVGELVLDSSDYRPSGRLLWGRRRLDRRRRR